MRNILLVLLAIMLGFTNVSAQAERANEIIKEARKALGGQKLESLQNLTAKGKLAESFGEGETKGGNFEFTIALPDKFLKTETKTIFGDDEITEIQAMNGANEWLEIKVPRGGGGGGGDHMNAAKSPKDAAVKFENPSLIRQTATRFFLGMFAAAPTSFPVEFSFAGTAQSPDGTADVLDVKGENFYAQLFIDQKTRLPLMIIYKNSSPMMRIAKAPMPNEQTMRKKIGKNDKKHEINKEEVKPANEMSLPPVNFQLTFEDFRETEGVRLPYRITESIDGKAIKEWNFTAYKLNVSVKPQTFTKSK